MNVNLELYKTFYYVAKNNSISRAANELLISQPAISKAIKTLEDQIDVKLFIRKRDGVELTQIGEKIFDKVKNAMELLNSVETDINSIVNMNNGNINIGASKTILNEFLMPYIKNFHQKYPSINIRIYTDLPKDLYKKMNMNLIDIVFTNLPNNVFNEFEKIKITDLHDCLVASDSFIQYKNKKLTNKDLENLPLLLLTKDTLTRIRFDNYCVANNLKIKPKMEFGSNTLIKDFTLASFGVGLLTEEHVKKELESNTLFKLDINLKLDDKYLGLVYDKNNNNLASIKFIEYIKESINN